uniref:CSON002974 protein n=1 Tax=Culicoides sonorensis TaxID=179676 RepID=A0A336L4L7_CULSO
MEFNFNSICRTCMSETAELHSIYEIEILKKIKICCGVQVGTNDGLPGKICQVCLNEVDQAFSFRERVKRSDISLRQILTNINNKKKSEKVTETVNVKAEPDDDGDSNQVMEVEYLEFEGDFPDTAEMKYSDDEDDVDEKDKENPAIMNVKCELEEENVVQQFQCEECLQCFKDKRTMVRHKYVHMGKQFKCTLCEKAYNRPDKLTAHMRKHSEDECRAEEEERKTIPGAPYECDKCAEKFNVKKQLRAHFYDSKSCSIQFECDQCHKILVTRKNYFRHLSVVHVNIKKEEDTDSENDSEKEIKVKPSTRFQCDKCNVHFASEKYYRLHIENNKCNNEPYTCHICFTVFSGKKALRRHTYTHKTEKYECNLCDKEFGRPDLLTYHKKRDHNIESDPTQLVHDPTLDPNEFGQYQCQACSAILKDRRNLKRHYLMHSDIKYKCTVCNKEYNRRYEMTKHMKSVHGEPNPAPQIIKKEKEPKQEIYKCETCSKEFTKRYKYKEHLAVHSDVRPFLCGQCGQAFKNKQTFLNHEIRHGDVKPFKCEECSKGYYTKKDLAVHVRSHTGEKPYVCTECGASYTRSDSLANHWKKHTGERPHACEFCPKRFIKAEKLKIHRRIHTGERPYACWICDQRFTQKYDMVKHARRHQEYHAPPNTTVVLN